MSLKSPKTILNEQYLRMETVARVKKIRREEYEHRWREDFE